MISYAQTVVREYSSRIEDDYIFFAPNLPPRKLENVLGSYASAAKDEEPLVLIDDTTLGSAKSGVLLTDRAIYAHETMESPQSLALGSIKSVSFKKGLLSSTIHINGEKFVACTLPDKKAMSLFVEMLGRISEEFDAHQQAPSQELETGTEETDLFSPSEPGAVTYLRSKYERSSPLTREDAHVEAGGNIGCGIAIAVVFGILVPIWSSMGQYYFAVLSIIGVLYGVWRIIRAVGDMVSTSRMENKQVKCPFCGHQHTVLMNAGWLHCENCGQLLLLGYSRAEPSLSQIECPYCNRILGVDQTRRGLGFNCDDCNLQMSIENGAVRKVSRGTIICANCKAVLDSTVFYCKECGQLTNEGSRELIRSTTIDERLRKSPHGHLILGKALLQHLQSTVEESEIEKDWIPSTTKAQWVLAETSTSKMLWQLAEMWESFEEAALNEFYHYQIAELLEPVDHLYAMLLLRFGATILSSKGRYGEGFVFYKPPEDKDDKTFFSGKNQFEWVVETRRATLNRLLATDEIKQSHQFGSWEEATSLFRFEDKSQLEGLFKEAERLSPGSVVRAEELGWF